MPKPVACTIASNNYLHFARTFARSFLEHNRDGEVFVLLVDRSHPSVDYAAQPFTTLFAEELGIPSFEHFAFKYSILELNTAVKPFCLEALERRAAAGSVCYFDPDILVTADLADLYQSLPEADATLIPHILEPIEDERLPNERDFLLSGIYNLGFLGISFNESTRRFLDWWQRRLYHYCLHSVEEGLFVDQKWMDFAPAFLPHVRVLRDPGYNVAYWNLMHRTLRRQEETWWVEGHSLRFFHFSGFDPDHPQMISKYQNRLRLRQRPDLQAIFLEYESRLRSEGMEQWKLVPYAFDYFDNGEPVPPVARKALRQLDSGAQRWPRPFATATSDSYYRWLLASPRDSPASSLPRLALLLRDERADLQVAFPDLSGDDEARYLDWLLAGGATEARFGSGALAALEAARRQRLSRPAPASKPVGTSSSREEALASASGALTMAGLPLAGSLPFAMKDHDWFLADADLESGRRPKIPRIAMWIHSQRPDLQRSFPDPLGASRLRFAKWLATYGRWEYSLPLSLVAPVRATLAPRHRVATMVWWARQRLRQALGFR